MAFVSVVAKSARTAEGATQWTLYDFELGQPRIAINYSLPEITSHMPHSPHRARPSTHADQNLKSNIGARYPQPVFQKATMLNPPAIQATP